MTPIPLSCMLRLRCGPAITAIVIAFASAAPAVGRSHRPPEAASAPSGPVVRWAPGFTFPAPGTQAKTLRSLRGQPVVLVIADSPQTKALRKQLKNLREIYQEFASRKVVFVAAFKKTVPISVESDVPFAIANDGPSVAASYGIEGDFSLNIIGKDGNLDMTTTTPQTARRIRDVIENSYEVQAASRKASPETERQ